ncbi:MAG: family ATPase [Solirubrobacterales bacterium]|nr:family ATPase [Solirubrobacterales bacterium]
MSTDAIHGAPIAPGADRVERLLADLNPAQREAVTHGDGPLLVLAGAGSGKTRVLTYRIAWLLATGQARPSEVLAITFTNKAAGEMRERVASLIGGVSRAMWLMTFHSACARILRAEAPRLGYKRAFTIYDEADSLRMVKRCMEELELDPKRYPPRAIRAQISSAKNQLTDAADYGGGAGSSFEEAVADVYALFERRMVEASAMDFDDLLVRTVNLLELFADVREKYRRIFRWVLVDEYQDTNRAQYRLLQLLADEHRNLTVVGDDFQAVYSFRGADIRNILEFERDFSDATTVLLEQNYRSTQTILDAANGLIAHNESQKAKHLWTAGARGERIVVAELDDEHAEARYVASEITRLVEEGTPRDRIAVFYRMNAQSRVLEDTLVRFEIPYQVIGGTKFYERAEIKDAVAYLQLLANPADAVSFARIVNSPRRGIGQRTQARILSHANTLGIDVSEVLANHQGIPGLGSAALRSVGRFAETMAALRRRAERRGPVAELLEAVLHESGYLEALEAERTIEAEGRVENLEELVGVAGEFDANRELEGESEVRRSEAEPSRAAVEAPEVRRSEAEPSRAAVEAPEVSLLEEFLAQISLISEQDNLRDEESLATLMSLHNAKGLEYDAVLVIGCEEGVFPHSRSLEEGNLEEERRLCYVGVTRARERLWMTFARRRALHGSASWNLPSRFLDELPEELVDRHVATDPTGWSLGGGDARRRATGFGERRAGGFAAPPPKQPAPPPVPYAVGDDVVHASFGEGVVTSVEAGSVVVVRFAGDGAERKLMADYAPLKKVA